MSLQKRQPVHDPIACATALAVLTANDVSRDQKTYGAIFPGHLLEAVQSFATMLKISLSEINRRIRQWIRVGWIELFADGSVRPTPKGIPALQMLSVQAASI